MQRVVLASGNRHKVEELRQLLAPLGRDIVPQTDLGVPAADETGLTFVENAILKARQACQHTGLPALADDSGIEVDALHGAPGIYSARYAGVDAADADNLAKLMDALKGVPPARRGARFQCLLVYMRHAEDPTPIICQGTWEGRILEAPRGVGGFGYDPGFEVLGRGISAAQLSPEEKNALSHRGQALRKLAQALEHLPQS